MKVTVKSRLLLAAGVFSVTFGVCAATDYPIRAASLAEARVTGGFWHERLETNRLVTLKTDFAKCNETPRIANFTNAAARAWGKRGGAVWDDSDVYKVMEGAAYILATHPDAELEGYMDWLIGQIAKAQEPDGYLYTARMETGEGVPCGGCGFLQIPSCVLPEKTVLFAP